MEKTHNQQKEGIGAQDEKNVLVTILFLIL